MDIPTDIVEARIKFLEAAVHLRQDVGPCLVEIASHATFTLEDELAYTTLKSAHASYDAAFAALLDAHAEYGALSDDAPIQLSADRERYEELSAEIESLLPDLERLRKDLSEKP